MHAKLWLRPVALAAALLLGAAGCGGNHEDGNGGAFSVRNDSFLSEVDKVIASTPETDPPQETDRINVSTPETVESAPLG